MRIQILILGFKGLIIQLERGTFQDSAAKLFFVLPANVIETVVLSKYTVGKLMPIY